MAQEKTVIIEYATVSPSVLEQIVKSQLKECIYCYKEVDEDYFEFTVYTPWITLAESVLARYVQQVSQFFSARCATAKGGILHNIGTLHNFTPEFLVIMLIVSIL